MNGPDEPPELRSAELLGALGRHEVQYLIVGGFAAQLYGATRQTKDVDLCPEWGADNLERLAAALAELGARLRLPPELGEVFVPPNARLLRETAVTHWRSRAGDVDVLVAIGSREGKPIGFRELEPRAVTIHVSGLSVVVAGLDDIIAAKERANRPKDLEALPELRKLRAAGASKRAPGSSPPRRNPSRDTAGCATGAPTPAYPPRAPPPKLGL